MTIQFFAKAYAKLCRPNPACNWWAKPKTARALAMLRALRPQVAVLDVDMPQMDGVSVARAMQQENLSIAVVLLTMHRNEQFFQQFSV